jgi:hypothetical protein
VAGHLSGSVFRDMQHFLPREALASFSHDLHGEGANLPGLCGTGEKGWALGSRGCRPTGQQLPGDAPDDVVAPIHTAPRESDAKHSPSP